MNPHPDSLALANIGGPEIILILVLFFVLAVVAVVFFGLIYLIVRAVQYRPPPVPQTLPPELLVQNQKQRDREQVKLLSIFHFIFAGLALLGIVFLCMHYYILHTAFSNPDLWKTHKEVFPPPKAFFDAFIWFYLFMGVILLAVVVLNLLSGLFLWRKRYRLFSMIIGGLDCVQIPFGTALGVFTIMVLSRDSVRELYSG